MIPTQKLIEAAEAAVECLESLQGGCTDSDDGTVEAITVYCPEVIEDLRTALQGLREAQAEPVARNAPEKWVRQVMEQAQVFASAWALVGSRFDNGGEMDNATAEKERLRKMISVLPATPPTTDAPAQGVALTDEQIGAAWDGVDMRHPRGDATRNAFARAIERAVWAANGIAAPHAGRSPQVSANEWKLVPVEPTDEMRDAGNRWVGNRGVLFAAWRDMLAAAPTAPAQAASGGEVVKWVCSKCGVDRLKAQCPRGHSAAVTGDCPMTGQAIVRATCASAPPAVETPRCDCTTATSPDGARRTYCGSDQMRRAVSEGHAFVTLPASAPPAGEPVNVNGPAELAPQPAPGLSFDAQGVLRPAADVGRVHNAERDESLGQAPPQGTTDASATNRVDHGGCPIDWPALIQRMYAEAAECDLYGITKPAALLREAAAAIQPEANSQTMDMFAEVTSAGHLAELVDNMRMSLHHLADEWEDCEELRGELCAATLREIAGDHKPHRKLPILPPDDEKAERVHDVFGNRWPA